MELENIAVAEIDVSECVRKDFTAIGELVDSIKQLGLGQPLVLSPGKKLIAGRRRLEAVKILGWKEVPCVTCDSYRDALVRAKFQDAENTCRRPLAVSEAVELGKRIERREKVDAEKRMKAGRPSIKKNLGSGRAAEIAANMVGMSYSTYRKAKEVVDSGKTKLIAQMDKTGKIDPVYRKLEKSQETQVSPIPKIHQYVDKWWDDTKRQMERFSKNYKEDLKKELADHPSNPIAGKLLAVVSDYVLGRETSVD